MQCPDRQATEMNRLSAPGRSASQDAAGDIRVSPDLINHRCLGLKQLLGPLERDQLRLDRLAIDVLVEIEEMDLHPGREHTSRWIDADVGDAWQLAAILEPGLRGVNA